MKYSTAFLLALFLSAASLVAQPDKAEYLAYMEEAAELTWERVPRIIEDWKANVNPSNLWGYNVTSTPVYLADLLGFLYEKTGKRIYAERAGQLLAEFGSLRDVYPDDYFKTRVEYENGVPLTSNFFFMPALLRSYGRVANAGVWDTATARRLQDEVAHTLDFVFYFPEWGVHNRAMLRAEAWMYGAVAMPDHPHAANWRQMAESIAKDNLREWEVEDASSYNPIWLEAVYSYADAAGETDLDRSPMMFYYADFYKRLFTPADNIPDYGDANWNASLARYLSVFERWARDFQDPEAKWVANRIYQAHFAGNENPSLGVALSLMLAYDWMDETIQPRKPTMRSGDIVDDMVGKKVVFRTGWDPDDTYLLLNYRDEGDGGWASREYLRNSLSVEEEKMHHGHSDENSISLLMSGRSVLLHDGGYRNDLPSGPYGGFRADYYHNRMVVRAGKRDRTQTVPEFIRNSGAYVPVRTRKLDFLDFESVEMSRTRLEDDAAGYLWDRSIIFDKEMNRFVVVDAVKVLKTGYYTFTNLWHTRQIHSSGPGYYDTSIDSIQTVPLPDDKRLLIVFPDTVAREDGVYDQERHFQDERAVYQSESSHYLAGTWEVFTTYLIPHDADDSVESLLGQIQLDKSDFPKNASFQMQNGSSTVTIGLKIDLDSALHPENIRPRYTWDLGKALYGPFETDAQFFYAKQSGSTVSYAAAVVTKVLMGERVFMESKPNVFGLQLDGAPDRIGYASWRTWKGVVNVDQ